MCVFLSKIKLIFIEKYITCKGNYMTGVKKKKIVFSDVLCAKASAARCPCLYAQVIYKYWLPFVQRSQPRQAVSSTGSHNGCSSSLIYTASLLCVPLNGAVRAVVWQLSLRGVTLTCGLLRFILFLPKYVFIDPCGTCVIRWRDEMVNHTHVVFVGFLLTLCVCVLQYFCLTPVCAPCRHPEQVECLIF